MIRFKRKQARPRSPRARRDHALTESYRIRCEAPESLRDELEIRLLGGQQPIEVASRTGVAPDVVECYEKVFFSVIDRLDCPVYISSIIDPTASLMRGEPSLGVIVRSVAYRCGPVATDSLIGYLRRNGSGVRVDEDPTARDEQFDRLIGMIVLAASLRADEASVPRLLRLKALVELLDRRASARLVHAFPMAPVFEHGEVTATLGNLVAAPRTLDAHSGDADVAPIILKLSEPIQNRADGSIASPLWTGVG